METNQVYPEIYDINNLFLAYKKARKGKSKKLYVVEFEKDLIKNLVMLSEELKSRSYFPLPLKTFILRDPKTRKISKSDFRDRVVHHSLVRVIEPIFDKSFIYDSCANRIGKGSLFALKRFESFKRRVTNNLTSEGFCLKADIKHYFKEVNHNTLVNLIKKDISDERVIILIKRILKNSSSIKKTSEKGMPLGNLTSQFFANIYLNELDYFVKHKLRAKHYIRYVDDFIILHKSEKQLTKWKVEINEFLKEKLKIELHPKKSRIISLSRGIDFIGFRNLYYHRLLRKRNIRKMKNVIERYKREEISKEKALEIFQGWRAYAKWANSFKLRKRFMKKFDSNAILF